MMTVQKHVRKSVIVAIHVDALEAINALHEIDVDIPAGLRRIQEQAKRELERVNND